MTSTGSHGKYSNYHYCIVRECRNTSVKTPGKLWIRGPSEINKRNTWLKLAKKDPDSLSPDTKIYFCEDHFDLENDMENYMQYKIMGSVKRIRMKPNCVPSRFDCQSERKRKLTPTPDDKQHDCKKRAVLPLSENYPQTYSMEMSTSGFHQVLIKLEDTTMTHCDRKQHDEDAYALSGLPENYNIIVIAPLFFLMLAKMLSWPALNDSTTAGATYRGDRQIVHYGTSLKQSVSNAKRHRTRLEKKTSLYIEIINTMPRNRLCIFGCITKGVTIHDFPNPEKFPEQFQAWVNVAERVLKNCTKDDIYRKKKICHKHFHKKYWNRNNRLNSLAVPSLQKLHDHKSPTHRFPNPVKFPELFKLWVAAVGGKLENKSDYDKYCKKRVCDKHFKDKDRNRWKRINKSAVPSILSGAINVLIE